MQPPYNPDNRYDQNARRPGAPPPPAELDPSLYAPPQPAPAAEAPQYGGNPPAGWPGQVPPQGAYAPQAGQQRQPGSAPPPLTTEEEFLDDEDAPGPARASGHAWKTTVDRQAGSGQAKKGYHVPRTGVVTRRKRSGAPYIVLAMMILAATAFAAIRHFAPQEALYGYVSAGVLSSRYTGSALIVRDETVYTQEGISQIDYIAEEGSDVNRTTTVCTVYTSGFNARELTTLKRFRDQIKEYHKTLIASSGAARDARLTSLDTQARDQSKAVRQMIQQNRGNLVNQEVLLTQTLQARQSYLRQKYPDDQKLSRLYDDENAQIQRISSWTKQYAAAADGIVSFYTDGYEPSLNLSHYQEYSPAEVRAMYNGQVPANPSATRNTVSIYRLVRDSGWAVLMLCDDRDWTPIMGQTYKLLIESFENTVVDATVESFTRAGGELLVRLSVPPGQMRNNILYIRSCQVQLGENVDSLTVPTRAIYSQMGQTGVVIVDEYGNNYFTPVSIISTQGDITHIIPKNAGYLYEGMLVKLF